MWTRSPGDAFQRVAEMKNVAPVSLRSGKASMRLLVRKSTAADTF
jgi:hypothetical protein